VYRQLSKIDKVSQNFSEPLFFSSLF